MGALKTWCLEEAARSKAPLGRTLVYISGVFTAKFTLEKVGTLSRLLNTATGTELNRELILPLTGRPLEFYFCVKI
jgi:hypothetical protein